eukprot:scaffold51837_cov56-Attheya_sp.AAC.2
MLGLGVEAHYSAMVNRDRDNAFYVIAWQSPAVDNIVCPCRPHGDPEKVTATVSSLCYLHPPVTTVLAVPTRRVGIRRRRVPSNHHDRAASAGFVAGTEHTHCHGCRTVASMAL